MADVKIDNRLFLLLDISEINEIILGCQSIGGSVDLDCLSYRLKTAVSRKGFPLHEFYLKNTQAGEAIEIFIDNKIFNDLTRVTGKSYDMAIVDELDNLTERVEVKSIRVMSNEDKSEKYPVQRAVSIFDGLNNISNTSFQQVKPDEFEYMIGILMFKDGVRIYKVPSDRFHPTVVHDKIERGMLREQNIITLSGQHKNNLTEGQVSFKSLDEFIKLNLYFDGENFFHIVNGVKTNQIFNPTSFMDL